MRCVSILSRGKLKIEENCRTRKLFCLFVSGSLQQTVVPDLHLCKQQVNREFISDVNKTVLRIIIRT